MPKVKVNGKEIKVEEGLTVLQACEQAGAEIPRFCYHEKLSIAGNCRMCLVELEKSPKPVASCAMPATEGMDIKTNTKLVEKARKGVMEFLLANHPLDCPVCDQGGECDLQDQSMFYGIDKTRFKENKRFVPEKYMGPLIKTQMTRCIHCTRCIRFATEIAGVSELGAIGRGEDMQITTYLEKAMESELSANVIDLCPVGALTSKPYVFEARPWELKKTETIDVMDAIGSNVRIDTFGWEVKRVLPKINEDINEEWISDKTRYSCDGLKYQRLDQPYIKENGKLTKTDWDTAYKKITDILEKTESSKICGVTGDLSDMETLYAAKEFFKKTLNSKYLESRNSNKFIDMSERQNYIFNSSINGIEESDLIFLVGANPRFEATILNARIRKTYLRKNIPIYSFGEIGDQTYPYKILNNSTKTIKEIFEDKSEYSKLIKNAQKPMIIIGQSTLNLKSAEYICNGFKDYLKNNNKILDNWNAYNVLSNNASTVGAFDLEILNNEDGKNITLEKVLDNQFEVIFLIGQDDLKFKKKNEFIIYIGSHGDKGAETADVVLPGAAYTEKTGHFTNLEGKIQKCYKASFVLDDAKEDWKIFNELAYLLKNNKLFANKDELTENMLNFLKNKNNTTKKLIKNEFFDESIKIEPIDYYFTNVISRSSKTMMECRAEKLNQKKTGTYN